MPWPVYSERFLYSLATVGTKVYRVPDEMRAIVTQLTIVKGTGGDVIVAVAAHGINVYFHHFLAEEVNLQVPMKVVVYQGESISLYLSSTTGGLHASVHGQLLADNTGRDGPPATASSKPIRPERPEGVPQ